MLKLEFCFPSTCRHADLVVDSDALKTSLTVKMIQVSLTRFTMRSTMQPYTTFHLLHTSRTRSGSFICLSTRQAPADACYVEEGCLSGTGPRKVHLAVHLVLRVERPRAIYSTWQGLRCRVYSWQSLFVNA